MGEPAGIVDRWRERQRALRWAAAARRAKTEEEKKRCWKHFVAHLLASLTGDPPDVQREQRKMFE
jgi:hypothetical protein